MSADPQRSRPQWVVWAQGAPWDLPTVYGPFPSVERASDAASELETTVARWVVAYELTPFLLHGEEA